MKKLLMAGCLSLAACGTAYEPFPVTALAGMWDATHPQAIEERVTHQNDQLIATEREFMGLDYRNPRSRTRW